MSAIIRRVKNSLPVPAISVLLPVFNGEATLAAALASVARQSIDDWECRIVDDGSDDRSAELARGWAETDPRFRLSRLPHQGLVSALAHGTTLCRGDLIARMDADDLMHRDRLRLQLEALRDDPGLDAVGCHVRLFPRSGLGRGSRAYEAWLNGIGDDDAVARECWIECPVAHPSLMIRGESLQHFGYRDPGWPEDYDLVLRMLTSGRRIGVVPRRLLSWRHTPGRHSRNSPTYGIDRFTECKAEYLVRSFLKRDDSYILWGYGQTGRTLRAALERRGRRPSHIVELHPGRLGNRIHGAPVVLPTSLPGLRRRPLVVSVAGAGPRHQIRAALAAMGFRERADFICAA